MAVIVIERTALLTEGHGLGADTPFVRELVPGLG
jgi:hypothetical protein